ncbi:MAG: DUF378 domain-containing protein [Candidatus Levybacteria bacterium]|nr:DUF378 domain-containing protein [Candidatus Levybacteria bacterium]
MKKFSHFNDKNDFVFWVVVIGAINWGLTALGFNLVNILLGSFPLMEKIVYLLIGVCGVILLLNHKNKNYMR